MGFSNIFSFVIVYLTCATSFTSADSCVAKSPCVCVFPNGTGIDLTPAISASSFYTADIFAAKSNETQFDLSTYYYHPCYDVSMNISQSIPGNTCTSPLSICRHVHTMTLLGNNTYSYDAGVYNFLGRTNISQFSDQGNSIVYANGPSETIVLLECAQTENRLQVLSLSEPDKIVLSFYSRDACLKQIEEAGRSFGSTLLIIFFSFVVFYLVLGICTKKFLMGATGVEVIPNLTFWSELPNLVKDGWVFLCNGCKLPARGSGPTVSPDPNSYDSI